MEVFKLKSIVKEAVYNIKHNLSISISSFIIIQTIFLFLSLSFTGTITVNSIMNSVQSDTQVFIQLEDKMNGEDLEIIINNIEKKFGAEVTYSSKEDELQKMIDYYGESGEFLNIYKDDNPLKNVLLVNTEDIKDIKDIAEYAEKMNHIYSVSYGENESVKTIEVLQNVKTILFITTVVFTLLSVIVLSNIIKLSSYSRKEEIFNNMQTSMDKERNKKIFVAENIFTSLFSVILPCIVSSTIYSFIYYKYTSLQFFGSMMMSPTYMILIESMVMILLLIISSWICSLLLFSKLEKLYEENKLLRED